MTLKINKSESGNNRLEICMRYGINESRDKSLSDVQVFLNSGSYLQERFGEVDKIAQLIYKISSALEKSTNDEERKECIVLASQLWERIEKTKMTVNNLYGVLYPYKSLIPEHMYNQIRCVYSEVIKRTLKHYCSDTTLLSHLMEIDEPMLIDILNGCKKSWFVEHTVTELTPSGKKRVRLPGLEKGNNEKLFNFIDKKYHPNWKPKNKKTIDDVLSATYGDRDTPEVRSHIGLIREETCNRKEKNAKMAFDTILEKIETESIKGHKTPDYIVYDNKTNNPIMTVECNSNEEKSFIDMCKKAIKHGDDKEIGWSFYSDKYNLPSNIIRAAMVIIDLRPDIQSMSDEEIVENVKSIKIKTKMDCFIVMLIDYCEYSSRVFVFNNTKHSLPKVFVNNIESTVHFHE